MMTSTLYLENMELNQFNLVVILRLIMLHKMSPMLIQLFQPLMLQ
jgi:hypothetical protein